MDTQKKNVLITGGGGDIGREIAKKFSRAGYRVLLNFRKVDETITALLNEINLEGGEIKEYIGDLQDLHSIKELFERIKKNEGRLDALINNAGVMHTGQMQMLSDESIEEMVSVNIKAPYFCMKFAGRIMMGQEFGCIVNIGSVVGRVGSAGQVMYSGSKGAIETMTKSAAQELASYGIRVNCISPGVINTKLLSDFKMEAIKKIESRIPLQRIGTTEQIADAVLFLCNAKSEYITGATLSVDGGFIG